MTAYPVTIDIEPTRDRGTALLRLAREFRGIIAARGEDVRAWHCEGVNDGLLARLMRGETVTVTARRWS